MVLAMHGIKGKNVIVNAPTGSGKTMVASLICKAHLLRFEELGENDQVAAKKPKVLYLVPRFTILQHIYR